MAKLKPKLTREDIDDMLTSGGRFQAPLALSPAQLAKELGHRSPKTIYEWVSRGLLEGTYRKRGKRIFFIPHRILDAIYNGTEWKSE